MIETHNKYIEMQDFDLSFIRKDVIISGIHS